MIAQAVTEINTWAAMGGFVTVVLVQLGKILSDSRKDKRDLLIDEQKQELLRRIADSNEKALIAQTETKGALEKVNAVSAVRYDTLLSAVNTNKTKCNYKQT